MNSSFTQGAESTFICPLCNAENRAGAKFCRRCGVSRAIMTSWGAPAPGAALAPDTETSAKVPALDELELKRRGLSVPGALSSAASSASTASANNKLQAGATGSNPVVGDTVKASHYAPVTNLASLRRPPGLAGEQTVNLHRAEPRAITASTPAQPQISPETKSAKSDKIDAYSASETTGGFETASIAGYAPPPPVIMMPSPHAQTQPSPTAQSAQSASATPSSYAWPSDAQPSVAAVSKLEPSTASSLGSHQVAPIEIVHSPECISCFSVVRSTDQFCCWCGERQPENNANVGPSCPNCLVPLPAGANFCFQCGKCVVKNLKLKVRVPSELFRQEDSEFFPTFDA